MPQGQGMAGQGWVHAKFDGSVGVVDGGASRRREGAVCIAATSGRRIGGSNGVGWVVWTSVVGRG
jgi:hypothetical protein